MPHEVIMPALGMAQETGTIVTWLKSEGEAVAAGDPIMEVETDKATMEVEAALGFLTGIRAAAGEAVPVGQVVAIISETADAPEASGDAAEAPDTPEATADAPSGRADAASVPEGKVGHARPRHGPGQRHHRRLAQGAGRPRRRHRSAARGRDRQGDDGGRGRP